MLHIDDCVERRQEQVAPPPGQRTHRHQNFPISFVVPMELISRYFRFSPASQWRIGEIGFDASPLSREGDLTLERGFVVAARRRGASALAAALMCFLRMIRRRVAFHYFDYMAYSSKYHYGFSPLATPLGHAAASSTMIIIMHRDATSDAAIIGRIKSLILF